MFPPLHIQHKALKMTNTTEILTVYYSNMVHAGNKTATMTTVLTATVTTFEPFETGSLTFIIIHHS